MCAIGVMPEKSEKFLPKSENQAFKAKQDRLEKPVLHCFDASMA